MESIKIETDGKTYTLDWDKIATNKYDALDGNYLNQDCILTEYWDPEELTIEDKGDGAVLIKEGDVAMGWTTQEALNYTPESVLNSQATDNVKSVQNADNLKRFREIEEMTFVEKTESSNEIDKLSIADDNIKYLEENIETNKELIETLKNELKNSDNKEELQNLIDMLENNLRDMEKELINLNYSRITLLEDYQNFNNLNYKNKNIDLKTTVDLTGAVQYIWDDSISPVDYLMYVKEKEGISDEEFWNYSIYNSFNFEETGNANLYKDMLHNDSLRVMNLLKASEYEPELLKMYNYIYYNEGINAANQFMFDKEENINQTIAQVNVQNKLKSGNIVINGLSKGYTSALDFMSILNANPNKTVEEWEDYYMMISLMTTEEKETLGIIDENGSSISPYIDFSIDYSNNGMSKHIYNISQGLGSAVPTMLLSTINPTTAFSTMVVSSTSNQTRSALVNGASYGDAIKYGALSGVSTAVLEKLLGAIPGFGNITKETSTGITAWLKRVGSQGAEGILEQGFDLILRSSILGEKVDFNQALEELGTAGLYSMAQAGILNSYILIDKNDPQLHQLLIEHNDGELTSDQVNQLYEVMIVEDSDTSTSLAKTSTELVNNTENTSTGQQTKVETDIPNSSKSSTNSENTSTNTDTSKIKTDINDIPNTNTSSTTKKTEADYISKKDIDNLKEIAKVDRKQAQKIIDGWSEQLQNDGVITDIDGSIIHRLKATVANTRKGFNERSWNENIDQIIKDYNIN